MRAIEVEARKQGADVMYVNASPTGTPQKSEALSGLIKFYEKQGFKVLRQSEANAEMYKPLPSAEYNQTRLDTIKTLEQNKANLEKEGFTFWVSEDPYFNEEGEEIEGPALGEEGSRFSVYAQDPLENDIAIAKFKIEDGELVPDVGDGAYEAVNVDASFRRKGIATELYRLAAETSGKPVSNKNRQTDGGKAFREALRDLAPETFYQDRPNLSPLGFYSQVERSIEGMDFKEMPAKDLAYTGNDPQWVVETLNARIEHEEYRAEMDEVRVKEQAAGKKLQEDRDWYKQQMDRFIRENSGLRRTVLDLTDLLNQKNSLVAYYDNRE